MPVSFPRLDPLLNLRVWSCRSHFGVSETHRCLPILLEVLPLRIRLGNRLFKNGNDGIRLESRHDGGVLPSRTEVRVCVLHPTNQVPRSSHTNRSRQHTYPQSTVSDPSSKGCEPLPYVAGVLLYVVDRCTDDPLAVVLRLFEMFSNRSGPTPTPRWPCPCAAGPTGALHHLSRPLCMLLLAMP
jgi:hypothetical protein